jgi:hypothetical protein
MQSILLFGFVLACDGDGGEGSGDDSGGGEVPTDADEDGYEPPGDCNDDDPDVHPDAAEQCDGIDQDCDGTTDENPTNGTSFYVDGDGDGYGASGAPLVACTAPSGYADNSSDCNDDDATLNPSTPWYTDEDGDGYGTVLEFSGCIAPGGTAPEDGDCDDANANDHPGADERCDTFDNDCDGATDEDPVNAQTWYLDADGDDYGDPGSPLVSCWQTSEYSASAADCNDADSAIHPGAIETCGDAIDSDCTGRNDNGCTVLYSTDATDSYVGDTSRDRAGESLTSLGDLGGDGQEDLAFGAMYVTEDTFGFTDAGAVYISETPGDGVNAHADESTDVQIFGDGTNDQFGRVVENGGDVNDDGVVDLVVGSGSDDINLCPYCGDIRIFLGPIEDGLVQSDADIQVRYDLEMYSDFGDRASNGDFDGDGVDDVIVAGSVVPVVKGSWADGMVLFYRGPLESGVLEIPKADAIFTGDSGSQAGSGLTSARDTDGDGVSDVAIGASGHDSGAGAVFVFHGPISGALDATSADVEYKADDPGDRFGARARWGGDLDGDGTIDLLASAPAADGGAATNEGKTFVFYGPLDTSMNAREALAYFEGSMSNSDFGDGLDGETDVDGDGFFDVLVGARSDDTYDNAAGGTFLFYGPFAGPRVSAGADVIFYGTTKDQSGTDVELMDYDGDGLSDIVSGAPNSAGASDGNGRIYLVAGSSFL